MSSTLRIAAVTSTLRHVLHESLATAGPGSFGGTEVTNVHPEEPAGRGALGNSAAGLDVFLYRVTASPRTRRGVRKMYRAAPLTGVVTDRP